LRELLALVLKAQNKLEKKPPKHKEYKINKLALVTHKKH